MSYTLIFDKKAGEELSKLEKNLAARIFDKLQVAKENPFRYFIRLKGRYDYKLRVGAYRIIADLNIENKRIEVTKVGRRSKIYDR